MVDLESMTVAELKTATRSASGHTRVGAICELGAREPTEDVLEALWSVVGRGKGEARLAIQQLARFGRDAKSLQHRIAQLDPTTEAGEYAPEALREMEADWEVAWPALVNALLNGTVSARRSSASALNSYGEKVRDVVASLQESLEGERDEETLRFVIAALGSSGCRDEQTMLLLSALLYDSREGIPYVTASAIEKLFGFKIPADSDRVEYVRQW
jgi:hypothetical protein